MTMLLARVVSLLLLVRLAMSQMQDNSSGMGIMPMIDEEQALLLDVQARYLENIAVDSRFNNHFFCINRTTIPNDDGGYNVTFTEFEQDNASVWTLFFQFPALAYLDPARKTALLNIVVNVLNNPNPNPPPNNIYAPSNTSDICIGTYEFYALTTFNESVLFHLYARYPNMPFNAEQIAMEFSNKVESAFRDESNNYVVPYPGQDTVMAFNLSAMMELENILLPPRLTDDGADPTLLAVFLGSFGSNITLSYLDEQDFFDDYEDRFAENPNPVNYGLEAGDIVFAVLGSILLALVGFLIVLGFCIHPFFLA